MRPPPNSTSRISDSEVTDLPEPDSPTTQSGLARPDRKADVVDADDHRRRRCRTRRADARRDDRALPATSAASATSVGHSRIRGSKHVAQHVARHVEAQHRQRDGGARHERGPGRDVEIVARGLDHQPPGGLRRLRAEPEERQARLRQDREGEADRRLDDDRRQDVGQNVPDDHRMVRRPRPRARPRHRASATTRSASPRMMRARNGVKATPMAMIVLGTLGPSMALMVSASSSAGKLSSVSTRRISTIVDPAAIKARDQPQRQAEREADQHRRHRRSQRGPRAEHDAIEQVAAELIGAEPMSADGGLQPRASCASGWPQLAGMKNGARIATTRNDRDEREADQRLGREKPLHRVTAAACADRRRDRAGRRRG